MLTQALTAKSFAEELSHVREDEDRSSHGGGSHPPSSHASPRVGRSREVEGDRGRSPLGERPPPARLSRRHSKNRDLEQHHEERSHGRRRSHSREARWERAKQAWPTEVAGEGRSNEGEATARTCEVPGARGQARFSYRPRRLTT